MASEMGSAQRQMTKWWNSRLSSNVALVVSIAILVWVLYGVSHQPDAQCDSTLSLEPRQELKMATGSESSALKNARKRKTLHLYFTMKLPSVDQGGQIMEYDWISNVLFGGIERPLRILTTEERLNDTVTVYLFKPPTPDYFSKLTADGKGNQGGFHMGDETMGDDKSHYQQASFIFRNYFNQEILQKYPNVHYAPLGVKTGFHSLDKLTVLPLSKRRIPCSFVGSIRSNRMEMITAMQKKALNCTLDYAKGWAARDGLHVVDYRNIVRETKFTLAAWGNNPESLRFYEALEVGSIPVFQSPGNNGRSLLTQFGPDHPFPQFDSWTAAADYIGTMLNQPDKLDQLQEKILLFWDTYKNQLRRKFRDVVDKSFRDTYGHDC